MNHNKAIDTIAHETIGQDTTSKEWCRWCNARYFVHTGLLGHNIPAIVRAHMLQPLKGRGVVHYSTKGL